MEGDSVCAWGGRERSGCRRRGRWNARGGGVGAGVAAEEGCGGLVCVCVRQ
jgi:hypothetical protein